MWFPNIFKHTASAEHLQALRAATGMTQPQFAAALGVAERTLREYERTGRYPYAIQFLAEALAMNTSISETDTYDNARAKFERTMCKYIEREVKRNCKNPTNAAVTLAQTLYIGKGFTLVTAIARGVRYTKEMNS